MAKFSATAEVQRQHAMVAKQKADQLAAEATVAYNQKVLDGLKGFSGIHSDPNAAHWDDLDDDDDLGDVLEFADGMRYDLPPPTTVEKASFADAQVAHREAATLQQRFQQEIAAPAMASGKSGDSSDVPVKKSDRFVDDFDRRARADAPPSASTSKPSLVTTGQPANRQSSAAGKILFNDRLGRLEPYAGKPQPLKKDPKSPAAVLQRHAPTADKVANKGKADVRTDKMTAGPTTPKDSQNRSVSAPAPAKKVESVWAKQQTAVAAPSLAEIAKEEADKKSAVKAAPKEFRMALAKSGPAPIAVAPREFKMATAKPVPAPIVVAVAPAAAPVVQNPAVPAVDPEASYRAQMQENAERARKRRVEAEQEREAQAERARKKAQELTERLASGQPQVSPITPTSILSPPATDRPQDSATSWRRPQAETVAEKRSGAQSPSAKTLLRPKRASISSGSRDVPQQSHPGVAHDPAVPAPVPIPAANSAASPSSRTPLSPTASSTKTPSSASFAALANFTQSIWSKPSEPSEPSVVPPAIEVVKAQQVQPAVAAPPTVPSIFLPVPQDTFAASAPHIPHLTGHEEQSPSSGEPIPRVKLNRSPIASLSQPTLARNTKPPANGSNASHASAHAQHVSAQTSALDKIMQQVRAAQTGMQAEKAEASRQQAVHQGQGRRQGNAATSRSWREAKPLAEIEAALFAKYVPEPFEQSAIERPASPRFWKTFNTKLPTSGRSLQDILPHRLLSFHSAHNPYPVFTSSWYRPREQQTKHQPEIELEAYLHPPSSDDRRYVVKFSRLFPINADQKPEFHDDVHATTAASTSNAVPVQTALAQVQSVNGSVSHRLDNEPEDFGAPTYTPLLEESEVVTVALPKKAVADLLTHDTHGNTIHGNTDEDDFATSRRLLTPDFTRFRSYGPKLPQNSTVAFRRNLSAALGPAPASSNMFMVSSEIGDASSKLASLSSSFVPTYDASRDHSWSNTPGVTAGRASVIGSKIFNEPAPLPTSQAELTDLDKLSLETRDAESQAAFATMKREDLPKHVVEELERLNASVGYVSSSVSTKALASANICDSSQMVSRCSIRHPSATACRRLGPVTLVLAVFRPLSRWSG